MSSYSIEKVYNAGSKKLYNVVCPTQIEYIVSITVRVKDPVGTRIPAYHSKETIPRFFYRPTIPFDNNVPRQLRSCVLVSDKRDKYCSAWSEMMNGCQVLNITRENMEEFWKITDKNYGNRNSLYVKDVDFSTIVFENSLKEYSQIYIEYEVKSDSQR